MTLPPTDPPPAEPQRLSGLVRLPAILLALLAVLAMPLALLACDVWRVVFNPPLVKAFLTDEVVASDLIPVALEWFSDRRAEQRVESGEALTGIDEPDIVLLMSYLDRDDWRAIREEVLTDEFLTHLVSVTVDGTYAWIDSDYRVPQVTYDLRPFIDRVSSEHGTNAILIAYDNLPPCTQPEIDDFLYRQSLVPPGTEVLYNLCQFPEPWHEDQVSDYVNALFKVVDNVPPQFALTDELAANAADPEGVGPEALKGQLRLIRFLGGIAWILPLIPLLLILVLAVRSLIGLSQWWGPPLLAGGLLSLLPTLAYRWLITRVLSGGALSEVPGVVLQEALRVVLRLADAIFTPMMLQALVIMGVSLALIAWAALKKRRVAPAVASMPSEA